jgi:hypothetical protein
LQHQKEATFRFAGNEIKSRKRIDLERLAECRATLTESLIWLATLIKLAVTTTDADIQKKGSEKAINIHSTDMKRAIVNGSKASALINDADPYFHADDENLLLRHWDKVLYLCKSGITINAVHEKDQMDIATKTVVLQVFTTSAEVRNDHDNSASHEREHMEYPKFRYVNNLVDFDDVVRGSILKVAENALHVAHCESGITDSLGTLSSSSKQASLRGLPDDVRDTSMLTINRLYKRAKTDHITPSIPTDLKAAVSGVGSVGCSDSISIAGNMNLATTCFTTGIIDNALPQLSAGAKSESDM